MATNGYRKGTPDDMVASRKASRKYFYLDDKLYKQLRFDNGSDSLVAWCYDDAEVVELSLAYVKKKRKPTYSVTQAAGMLNRNRMNLNHLFLMGVVPPPKRTYNIQKPNERDKGQYRLTYEDVFKLHAYYAQSRNVKIYRRSQKPLPSRRELAAMMKYEKITYLQTKTGEFVPVWNAPDVEDWL